MPMFANDIIPWKEINAGQKIDWQKLLSDAKAEPLQFGFELFAVAMIVVGAVVAADLAFELGRLVGRGF